MQDSLLIDGFAEDTNRDEWLDDVYVDPVPASIARMCADYGNRVTLIDPPGDPNHFGDLDSEPTAPPDRSGRLQAGVLHATRPQTNGRAAGEGPDPAERSPRPTGRVSRHFLHKQFRRGVRSGAAAVASPGMATTCPHPRVAGGPR